VLELHFSYFFFVPFQLSPTRLIIDELLHKRLIVFLHIGGFLGSVAYVSQATKYLQVNPALQLSSVCLKGQN